MKKTTIFLILVSFFGHISAQEIQKVAKARAVAMTDAPSDTSAKHWRVNGSGSVQFTQAAFSNWSSGGQNNIGLVLWMNLKANYRNGKNIWSNTVDMGYGFNILGNAKHAKFNKSNDKIELTTAYGYQLHKNQKWFLTVLINFRTQFSDGFNYPNDSTVLSKFMSPAYLVAGIGVTFTPTKWFSLYISPASGRFTFVTDQQLADSGAFGVKRSFKDASGFHHGKKVLGEFGPYLRADLNKDLSQNINLTSSLELFTNYLHHFGNIDVNWSLLLSMKVNKWLAASIQTQLIYDDEILIQPDPTERARPMTQFKELFGIGLTYKLN